ncbi:hypothetical protein MPER_08233, partial [Moniliophthora perniciosa FA553]
SGTDMQKGCKKAELCKGYFRVYSTPASWDDEKQARMECASVAMQDGIIDYIRSSLDGDPEDPPPSSWSNLQHFYESLPQSFPENFGGSTAEQNQAVKWLDDVVRQAGDVKHTFFIIHNKKEQLFGFVLRLEHASETKTYLVEPRFKKEKEAKAAVCLQAISQGVGDHLRALKSSAGDLLCKQNSISTEIKFSNDKGAFGATLKVKLVEDSAHRPKRKYTVPKEYRTKDDAEDALGNAIALAKEAESALAHKPCGPEPGELIGQGKPRKATKIPEFSPPFSLSSYKPSWNLPAETVAHSNVHVELAVPAGKRRSDQEHDERKRKKMKTKDG